MPRRWTRSLLALAVALPIAGFCYTSLAADPAAPARPVAVPHGLKVDGIEFSKVIDYLRNTSGLNIVVNWHALEDAGVKRDTPITLDVSHVTLRKVLRLVLDQASPSAPLVWTIDSNVLTITTEAEADKVLITRVYVVDDLVMTDNATVTPPTMNLQNMTTSGSTSSSGSGGGTSGAGSGSLFNETTNTQSAASTDTSQKRGEDLAKLITQVVRPSVWDANGGPASIRYMSGKLIVSAPASIQEAIGGPVLPEGGQRMRGN
jgi:hypothetical protein